MKDSFYIFKKKLAKIYRELFQKEEIFWIILNFFINKVINPII